MNERPPVTAHKRFQERAEELSGLPLDRVFQHIHDTNLWGAPESVSGLGSELDATRTLREALPALLAELKVEVLLDLPCGDFGWLSRTELPVKRYVGGDIVASIVERNRALYGKEFMQLDLCSSELPKADLVLCRDCLVHLPFEWIERAVANLKRSGSKWLLTTTFLECDKNEDIAVGDWRILNLELAPFCWKPPERVIVEGCTESGGGYRDKALGLWQISEI